MKHFRYLSYLLVLLLLVPAPDTLAGEAPAAVPFVVQLTRPAGNYGHRRVMLQLDKILDTVGEERVHFVVVAYEEGIHALLADNEQTAQLVMKLARRGVEFRACRISMRAWGLEESEFPLEVEFVPAGAPEVIRLQLEGYRYWRP
ncbi:MAG: hypothetical protein D6717_07040 [Gammaproteobacteria bacterium]|nr:MAG: hypothetical protein D6717_07040 [Gammaproteobacteria bacterium]